MSDNSVHGLDLRAADTLARVLDDYYVDPALGFFLPGLGDVLGSLAGLAMVAVAWRRRLSRALIARMLMNLAIDAAVGAIPLVGDAFDVAFKAHTRNAALLRERVTGNEKGWQDSLILLGAGVAFVAALALPLCLGVWIVSLIVQAIGKG